MKFYRTIKKAEISAPLAREELCLADALGELPGLADILTGRTVTRFSVVFIAKNLDTVTIRLKEE